MILENISFVVYADLRFMIIMAQMGAWVQIIKEKYG